MQTYIFKTNLFGNKKISRTIEILGEASLYKLAEAIVGAYDFDFDHCFGFYSNIKSDFYHDSEKQYELFADLDDVEPTEAGSVKKTKISSVWQKKGDKMMFLFDYGDGWRFLVEFDGFGKKESDSKYPRIIEKIGKAPEQYPQYEDE